MAWCISFNSFPTQTWWISIGLCLRGNITFPLQEQLRFSRIRNEEEDEHWKMGKKVFEFSFINKNGMTKTKIEKCSHIGTNGHRSLHFWTSHQTYMKLIMIYVLCMYVWMKRLDSNTEITKSREKKKKKRVSTRIGIIDLSTYSIRSHIIILSIFILKIAFCWAKNSGTH